ncbi:DUF4169 family protein [Daeguia caeni]|uniref:DUF4169 family protein n=1 Tax=Daeguia caeni TaxID=439612 RepID=A0ABV9H633_9HYPH
MSEIINLRQFRKRKARDAKERQAEQNRILFGRTRAEKELASREAEKAERFLERNRLERPAPSDDTRE